MPRSLRSTRQMDQQTVRAVPASVEAVSASAEGPPAGTQRSVMKFMPGKISANKYEQRVDNCTKQQLSLLLNSADYQRFQKSKLTPQSASWKPLTAALFGLFCLIALFLAALAPQYLLAHQQQVRSASNALLASTICDKSQGCSVLCRYAMLFCAVLCGAMLCRCKFERSYAAHC